MLNITPHIWVPRCESDCTMYCVFCFLQQNTTGECRKGSQYLKTGMLRLIFLYKSRKSLSSYMVLSYKIPFLCQAYNTPKVVTLCETYSNLTYYRDLSCTNCVAVGYYYNTKSNYTEYVHPTFPEVYVLQVSA